MHSEHRFIDRVQPTVEVLDVGALLAAVAPLCCRERFLRALVTLKSGSGLASKAASDESIPTTSFSWIDSSSLYPMERVNRFCGSSLQRSR